MSSRAHGSLRSVTVVQWLALVACGCRPPVARVEPVVRDYMAMCPPDARNGVACAPLASTCSTRYSMCSPMPAAQTDASQPPVPPRCSAHEQRCECVSMQGAGLAWACRSELTHPAGPQPPPELSLFA